jgi:hypothetical protein
MSPAVVLNACSDPVQQPSTKCESSVIHVSLGEAARVHTSEFEPAGVAALQALGPSRKNEEPRLRHPGLFL